VQEYGDEPEYLTQKDDDESGRTSSDPSWN